MPDIIIIGAGVSGCAIARELSRKKADVLVVEREEDVCCGTTKANSAIVHAGYDAANGSLMAKLNVEGSRLMPELARELDFHYIQNGSLVVMLSEEDRPNLMKLYENGVKNGVEGLRIIERDEPKCIKFAGEGTPIPVNVWIQLLPHGEGEAKLRVTIGAEVNFFMKGMVSKPLQQAANGLADILAAAQ